MEMQRFADSFDVYLLSKKHLILSLLNSSCSKWQIKSNESYLKSPTSDQNSLTEPLDVE